LPREASELVRVASAGDALLAPRPNHSDVSREVPTSGVALVAEAPSLPPPIARFGKYDVVGRVAVGGMAEIFLARETLPGGALRKSALKIIKRTPSSPEDGRYFEELFLREGRTVVQLAHPNICHVYDIGCEDAQFFIAMEWIDGPSLRDVLARLAEQAVLMPPAIAVGIAAQVASALEYAHTARDARGKPLHVVHRDVNPQNIMLRYDGSVKLVDFGVAQVSAEVDSRASTVKGKPSYMAPEQLRGEAADARTDVFALGVCLYEMLSGLRLHKRATMRETLSAVIQEPTPALTRFVPGLPDELDAIVQRALRKRPEERFASAGELQAALEGYLAARGEIGSARSVGGLMTRLYPEAGASQSGVDTSEEATACFSAPSEARGFRIAGKRLNTRRALLLGLLFVCSGALGGLLALRSRPSTTPGKQASAAMSTSASPQKRALPKPAAKVLAKEVVPTSLEVAPKVPESPARTPESPVEPERHKRRRTSPGFVADPGF
jgi:serine/threonine-protein kinase